jgi:pyruvate dehydrogenase E1 component alpha subunit
MPRRVEIKPTLRSASEHLRASERVASFAVRYTQFLDANGHLRAELPSFAADPRVLVRLYKSMVFTRVFDRKAVALQRTGQLGTYPSSLGQEATAIGLGAAMAREDVLLATYRETGAMIIRGVQPHEILQYWGGDERGSAYSGSSAPAQDFPISVPIGTHAPHSVGVAYAFKVRGEPRVAVCVLGDGATSKGDFYEAMNAAGVWQLPLVFVIVNNEWAISVPRRSQSHATTLAQKAISAGIGGEQVDGNDLIAVHDAMDRALAKARSGGGPHVIEALTYRMSDHTTADDARRYRSDDELERWQALDPIARLRAYLTREGRWSDADEQSLAAECEAAIDEAVAAYRAVPAPAAVSIFDHLFATLPDALKEQRDELLRGHDNG